LGCPRRLSLHRKVGGGGKVDQINRKKVFTTIFYSAIINPKSNLISRAWQKIEENDYNIYLFKVFAKCWTVTKIYKRGEEMLKEPSRSVSPDATG